MVYVLAAGAWLLFMLPALVASRRAQRLDPRPGSLLAPTVELARTRLVLVVVATLGQALVIVAAPKGDYIDHGVVLVYLAMIATGVVGLWMLIDCARGLFIAIRIALAARRVRGDAEVGPMPGGGHPTLDFGVGQTCWLFRSNRAARYREPAASVEWALGTPPPRWAAFVGPALDLLYAMAFFLIAGFDHMLTLPIGPP